MQEAIMSPIGMTIMMLVICAFAVVAICRIMAQEAHVVERVFMSGLALGICSLIWWLSGI